jgi:hypothetical protein
MVVSLTTFESHLWESADILRGPFVRGKDPGLYRQEPYGNAMYRHSHGKISDMGWEVDHITLNRRKGDTLHTKNGHSK